MPKTPKFIVDMKSHPRSPKHGNRKPSPPAHGNPTDGAGTGDKGAVWRTLYHGVPLTRVATIPAMPFDPGVRASHLKDMQQHVVDAFLTMQGFTDWVRDELSPKPPELPHAGIRASEIIGWRLWWVNCDGRLRSLVRDEIFWEPGEAMTGDINRCVHISLAGPDRFGGVYCFNNYRAAMDGFSGMLFEVRTGRPIIDGVVGFILGTVKLWGEVVEHEDGYRASFAKPNEFLKTYYWNKAPTRDPYELYFGETK